jgi:hypothetical protein
LYPNITSLQFAQFKGQKVKEKGSVAVGVDRDHIPFDLLFKSFVNIFKVGRFTTPAGAVVYDFTLDLPFF